MGTAVRSQGDSWRIMRADVNSLELASSTRLSMPAEPWKHKHTKGQCGALNPCGRTTILQPLMLATCALTLTHTNTVSTAVRQTKSHRRLQEVRTWPSYVSRRPHQSQKFNFRAMENGGVVGIIAASAKNVRTLMGTIRMDSTGRAQ